MSQELPRPRGVFARRDAVRRGYDDAAIRRELRSGRWVRLRHGIYAPALLVEAAAGDERLMHALAVAELCARRWKAAASHSSAAWLHGLATRAPRPAGVLLTVDRDTNQHRQGVDVRVAALPPHHVDRVLGLPTTSPARTVVDLARELPFGDAVTVADSALRLGSVDDDGLRRVLGDCRRWPGIESAAATVDFADARAESALESLGRVLCRDHDLPRPQLQMPIVDDQGVFAFADLGWPDLWTVGECDGLLKYSDAGVLRREKLRQERIERAGYEVVRMTWHQVTREPERTVARIRDAFARARRRRSA